MERWCAVVCGTNGVEHERLALRRFARVYGMVIQLPAQFEKAGRGHRVVCADERDPRRRPLPVRRRRDRRGTRRPDRRLTRASVGGRRRRDDEEVRQIAGEPRQHRPTRHVESPAAVQASSPRRSRRASTSIEPPVSGGSRRRNGVERYKARAATCSSTFRPVTRSSAARRGRA